MMYYVFWCPVHPQLKPKGAPMLREFIPGHSLMPSAPQYGIAPISSHPQPSSWRCCIYIYMSVMLLLIQ